MKVFISYGGAADQLTALRLQALAAVNGLTVYVPPAYTRPGLPNHIDPESAQKLGESDVILGVAGYDLTEACGQELNAAAMSNKGMIIMANPVLASRFNPQFAKNLVVVDPVNPGQTEQSIVHHLTNVAKQNEKKALLALGTLALGLIIF